MAPNDESLESSGGPPSVPPELYRTLDSLEDLVDLVPQSLGHARSVPLDDFRALTARLREEMPRAITQADEIAARAEGLLNDARGKAESLIREAQAETDRILEAARKEAAGKVTESPEVQFAEAQRRDIIAQAQQTAMNIRQDVDGYARETLDRLEDYVKKLQNQIRSGLVALDREKERDRVPPARR
jgi:vacuolar-type H+-ATPase subunit H